MERDYMNMNKLSVSNQQNQANKVFFFEKMNKNIKYSSNFRTISSFNAKIKVLK